MAEELAAPADPAVAAVADAARAAHGPGVCAVLFYGSCRRDGYREGLLVDLYLMVDDYASVHRSRLMRWLNQLDPAQRLLCRDRAHRRQRFAPSTPWSAWVSSNGWSSPATLNPYFWARFAQPTGLLWSRDPGVGSRDRRRLVAGDPDHRPGRAAAGGRRRRRGRRLWSRALTESYRTELRAEKPQRAAPIVARRSGALSAGHGGPGRAAGPSASRPLPQRRWFWRRVQGKALSLLRLAKASWTFAGGADYLAWKISRHAGVPVEFSPWERRHPLLAAPFVLWRLARRGVVR